jgi:hypothetical protein
MERIPVIAATPTAKNLVASDASANLSKLASAI